MNRSYLMVAGDKQKHLDKLSFLKCDKAIVNLEDGVYDKNYARELVKNNLIDKNNQDIIVRVNALDVCGKEDIQIINQIKPLAIRVPKIKSINDVKLALELIDDDVEVHLSIETKEAFKSLSKLKINSRVTTVYLGILDLLESLKLPQNILKIDNPTIDYILSKFLIDSKVATFEAVSFVYQDYKNTEEFSLWCKKEKAMGFTSKGCISPTQVDIINEIFSIDELEIQKGEYIVEIFEKNMANGITGFADEKYGFIDEPIYKNALSYLNKN